MENVKKLEVSLLINIMFISLSLQWECIARVKFDSILDLFGFKLAVLDLFDGKSWNWTYMTPCYKFKGLFVY